MMNEGAVNEEAARPDCKFLCALDEEVCLPADANPCNRVIACMHES
jgi:hypothetical protein